jgi:1,4-dihydroxy-2-naphthoate polyprenyltransferase
MNGITLISKSIAWLKLIRLQFYPMALIVYCLGAALAFRKNGSFNANVFWLGYGVLFLLEMITVFLNEYYDYETDKINRNAGLFNGGSQVLVKGVISRKTVKRVAIVLFLLLLIIDGLLMIVSPFQQRFVILILLMSGILLGPGYTMPPLKLCYRSFGEVVVGFIFSFYLILCGYVFQGQTIIDPLPWLLSIPLFFAILPSITLSAIPDLQSDIQVAKKTLAVRLGAANAIKLAAASVAIAAFAWGLLFYFGILQHWTAAVLVIVFSHALLLISLLIKLSRSKSFDRRFATIMLLTISYISWFAIIPLLAFISIR